MDLTSENKERYLEKGQLVWGKERKGEKKKKEMWWRKERRNVKDLEEKGKAKT